MANVKKDRAKARLQQLYDGQLKTQAEISSVQDEISWPGSVLEKDFAS